MFDPVDGDRKAVGDIEQHAETDGRPADHDGTSQHIPGIGENQSADNDDRNGRNHQLGHELEPGIPANVAGPAHPFEHQPDIAPQIRHHGAERADMNGNVDDKSLILPPRHAGDQDQVA